MLDSSSQGIQRASTSTFNKVRECGFFFPKLSPPNCQNTAPVKHCPPGAFDLSFLSKTLKKGHQKIYVWPINSFNYRPASG